MIAPDASARRPICTQPSHMSAGYGFPPSFPQTFPQNLWITSVHVPAFTNRHIHYDLMTIQLLRSSFHESAFVTSRLNRTGDHSNNARTASGGRPITARPLRVTIGR